jgi:hypothetical protein
MYSPTASASAPPPATVETSALGYNPSVSLDEVDLHDLRLFGPDGKHSASQFAAIRCVDDFQGMLAGFCIAVSDRVRDMPRPAAGRDASEWSWILATVGMRCAEGPVYLTGPGVHSDYLVAPAEGVAA